MSQSDDFFEGYRPHTKLKLAILQAYLWSWAMKLIQWGRGGRTLYVVDAFAGPGKDEQGNDGSPTLAARIAAATETQLRDRGIHDAKIRLIAIEQKASHFRALCEHIAPFDHRDPGCCRVLRGELADHINTIMSEIGAAPSLFFLDPFGVKGLDASTYPKMLSGPQNEMFVLFADMGAGRLHGAVVAESRDVEGQIREMQESPSLFADWDAEEEARVRNEIAESAEALDLTKAASREHLARALGEDWERKLESMPRIARPDAFLRMFMRVLVAAGAKRLLTVPMRDEDGRRVYCLVYATKSPKGFATMKEAVSSGLGRGELPEHVCEMIREDLRIDIGRAVEALSQILAGETVWWSAEDPGRLTLTTLLLEQSPIFPFQLRELKAALKSKGLLVRERKDVVRFPAQTGSKSGG